jgi:chromate reductase, NAD(P)H dehydrogenase (quinone)
MAFDVAVIVGSLRKGAFTRAIANNLVALADDRLKLRVVEIADLPLFNPDLDEGTPPPAWTSFRASLAKADAVLFVTPEYNRSIPGALKNAIDVGSRPYGQSAWNGKPAAIVSVSPGNLAAFGANHHLRQPLVFLNMPTMQQPEAYISKVGDLLDAAGKLTSEDTRAFLTSYLGAFATWIGKTK